MTDTPPTDTPPANRGPELLRVLGPGTAVAIVVGNTIGSGIFYKPGKIAAAVGDFPLIISAWLIGGGICILGALCIAELAAMHPRAGGLYVYLREAYGKPVAFLFGWTDFLLGKPASTGALAVAFAGALDRAAGLHLDQVSSVKLALSLIIVISWINILGVIWGGRLQVLTTIIKAGFLGLVALLPFFLWFGGSTQVDFHNLETTVTPTDPRLTTQLAVAMLAVMWAYNGWHGIAPIAEEVRNPARNLPLSLFVGTGILIVLYVGANIAYHVSLSMTEMAAAGENAAQDMIHKLLAPFGTHWDRIGLQVMTAVILCSTLGAINSNLLEGSRVSFAMGRDDVFFRALGRVHPTYRTPAVAIVVMGMMTVILVIGSASLIHYVERLRTTNVFEQLTGLVVFSASLFYMLAVLAVIVLRIREPRRERPFRLPGYPLVPLLYLAFYAWFLYQIHEGTPDSRFLADTGLAFVALGLPVYFAWQVWAAWRPRMSGSPVVEETGH